MFKTLIVSYICRVCPEVYSLNSSLYMYTCTDGFHGVQFSNMSSMYERT